MSVAGFFSRIKSNWELKLVLGFWVTLGFVAIYVLLARYPLFSITQVKVTWMDRKVPFVPGAVYLYMSLWLMMPLSFWMMRSKEELSRYCYGFLTISIIGFGIFFLYPTACPRPKDLHIMNRAYATLIRLDNELNAFPSLHAALAIFCGSCCNALCRTDNWHSWTRWVIWAWVFGIVASTLLTKQHALIDAAAGVILGFGIYALCWRIKTRVPVVPA